MCGGARSVFTENMNRHWAGERKKSSTHFLQTLKTIANLGNMEKTIISVARTQEEVAGGTNGK